MGYGRTKTGYIPMGFGPVSRDGGECRLNVLISRAKSRGAAALKAFLHCCRTGKLHMPVITDREMDSIFEEQVAKAIAAHGWQVVPQVGLAGFFIDLGIADAERPGRFILGIECDGATYHSSRSARDGDRLRQSVLEDHGWIIHHIWSTDWFSRPDAEVRKALAAIEVARAELDERGEREQERERAVTIELVAWERDESLPPGLCEEAVTARPYREGLFPISNGQELHEVSISILAALAAQVVAVEGPVHGGEGCQSSAQPVVTAKDRLTYQGGGGKRIEAGGNQWPPNGGCRFLRPPRGRGQRAGPRRRPGSWPAQA